MKPWLVFLGEGEKDLEEMMLRGTGELIKFWDNVRGILVIICCLSLNFRKKDNQ